MNRTFDKLKYNNNHKINLNKSFIEILLLKPIIVDITRILTIVIWQTLNLVFPGNVNKRNNNTNNYAYYCILN